MTKIRCKVCNSIDYKPFELDGQILAECECGNIFEIESSDTIKTEGEETQKQDTTTKILME